MNRSLLMLSGALAVVAAAVPASAATTIVLKERDGSLSGKFGKTDKQAGMFSDSYTFDIPTTGTTAGSINTVAVSMATNIDFISVLLNGVAFNLSPTGFAEFGSITMPALVGTNTLVVNGMSGGNASYSGTIVFAPSAAVPEPATWALMLLGFGFVGGAMRRRKANVATTQLTYA